MACRQNLDVLIVSCVISGGSKKKTSSGSSTSSWLSTKMIQVIVEDLKHNQHQSSTKRNYYAVWKVFNEFFIRLDEKPDKWEDRLTLFVGHMVSLNHQSSTVHSYISAIRVVLKMNNIKVSEDQFLLASLTKACKLRNDKIRTWLPIQKGLLNVILTETKNHFLKNGQGYLAILYQTWICVCYYGLLRVSEVCSGGHPVLAKDVHIAMNKKKFLMVLHTSKTHGLGSAPHMIKFTANSREVRERNKSRLLKSGTLPQPKTHCPYYLLKKFVEIRGNYHTDSDPFFIFRDGSPIQPWQFSSCLKHMLRISGFDQSLYGMHSLRSGRSCDLYRLGLSVETIKKLGRWRSNVVFRYLRT